MSKVETAKTKKTAVKNSKCNRNSKSKITKKEITKKKVRNNKILKESNKINLKENKKDNKKTLQINQSNIISNNELREKISKLANCNEKGIKYLTFQEFENCEEINKKIINLINKSKKIVILTGAGISCNAGIPDFRSDNGLYNKRINDYNNNNNNTNNSNIIKGKEMFDVSVYRSIETINLFNRFIFELYKQVTNSKPTITHEFIKKLQNKNKLVKCYTQNIDGLERECGLTTEFNFEEWNNTNVIQLHGDLHQLCCNSCKCNYKWDEIYDKEGRIIIEQREEDIFYDCKEDNDDFNEFNEDNEDLMILSQNTSNSIESGNSLFSTNNEEVDYQTDSSSLCEIKNNINSNNNNYENKYETYLNNLIECPKCIKNYENRVKLGKRSLESSIGIIRPNIVLYGEEHPFSEKFAKNLNKDLNKKPNLLIIFGTSLKVNGVKNLVRKMSNKIHENDNGLVLLINKDPISPSCWRKYIDYQIVSDCDAFCKFIEGKLPNVFNYAPTTTTDNSITVI